MGTQVAIVWNPSKAEKEILEDGLTKALGADSTADVRWWETTEQDAGQGVTRSALAAGADVVIIAGGDGTVRAVAEHLAEVAAPVEMGIIPLGTGNLFARNLGIPIDDIPAAFRQAINGEPHPVDVGWADVELAGGSVRNGFVVMAGFGVDAQMIAETDEDLKDKAGWLAYVESLGRALSASDVISFTISVDDAPPHDEQGHTFLVANCGTLQGGLTLIQEADPSDGELDYLVLSAEGLAQWLATLKTLVWDNGLKRRAGRADDVTNTDSIRSGRAAALVVTLPEPCLFEIDGEEIGETRAFTVSVQPSAIRVRCARD